MKTLSDKLADLALGYEISAQAEQAVADRFATALDAPVHGDPFSRHVRECRAALDSMRRVTENLADAETIRDAISAINDKEPS
jgi:hypothetical protein